LKPRFAAAARWGALQPLSIRFELLFDVFADGLIMLPFLHIGRLFIPLVLLDVGQNARLLAGLGEPTKSFLEGFTGSYDYACHGMLNSPLFRAFDHCR
jgi:hypothetical protein